MCISGWLGDAFPSFKDSPVSKTISGSFQSYLDSGGPREGERAAFVVLSHLVMDPMDR